ncbi:MAG: DUF6776 family protein [Burkholderiales bacterium]
MARSSSTMRPSGVSGPMAIRARMGLGWRITWASVAIVVFLGGGFIIYEVGKRAGIADAQVAVREHVQLKERVSALTAELDGLRAAHASSDSRIQLEKSAQGQLATQLQSVETENARLKEELTFFETLLPGGKDDRLTIHSLRVEPSGKPGEYRYRMLLFAGEVRRGQEFHGSLELILNVERDGQKLAVITMPDVRTASDPAYKLSFRRIQRVEGLFRVDPTSKVKSVQVRVLENGSTQPRATQSFSVS